VAAQVIEDGHVFRHAIDRASPVIFDPNAAQGGIDPVQLAQICRDRVRGYG
jgi:hypothetical protein